MRKSSRYLWIVWWLPVNGDLFAAISRQFELKLAPLYFYFFSEIHLYLSVLICCGYIETIWAEAPTYISNCTVLVNSTMRYLHLNLSLVADFLVPFCVWHRFELNFWCLLVLVQKGRKDLKQWWGMLSWVKLKGIKIGQQCDNSEGYTSFSKTSPYIKHLKTFQWNYPN